MENLGVVFPGDYPSNKVVKQSKFIDKKGLDSVWVIEDYFFRASFPLAGAVMANTENVKVGVGCPNVYTRTPALTAMSAATVDEISSDRFILGLGAGVKGWIEQQGIEWNKNLGRVREFIDVVRKILANEKVDYSGDFYTAKDIELEFEPPSKKIPIYIAAMGPKMTQLSGEISNGVLLSVCTPAEWLDVVKQNLEKGAKRSGKSLNDINIASYILVSMSEDRKKAMEKVKPMIAFYLSLPIFDAILEDIGMTDEVAPVSEAYSKGNKEEAFEYMTEDIIDTFAVAGTPEECREKLEGFVEAGVNEPLAWPIMDVKEMVNGLAED